MTSHLLPPGCYDLLPPYATQESTLIHQLLQGFGAFGYEEVSPPLIEYTDSLLSGRGSALSSQVFRVMDPGSDRMMGVRADHTMQIGRIAATRLSSEPLPLRLSYAGTVVHARGVERGRARVLKQAGAELIGPFSPEADAEVILVAASALKRAGIKGFVIDLNMPGIVSTLLAEETLDNKMAERTMEAIAHKDSGVLASLPLKHSALLAKLVTIAGPMHDVLDQLAALDMPAITRQEVIELEKVAKRVMESKPGDDITLTLDPTESRGFEYHTGVMFSFFAPDVATDLGRGGRYRIEYSNSSLDATGVTLYVSMLLPLLQKPKAQPRVLVAEPEKLLDIAKLQGEGYVTLLAQPDAPADAEEAKRLRCTHLFKGGKLQEV